MDKRGKLASLGMIGRLSHLPTVGPLVQVQARLRCYLEFGEAVTERNDPCEIKVCASQCDSLYAYTVSVIVVSLTPYRQDRRSYRKASCVLRCSHPKRLHGPCTSCIACKGRGQTERCHMDGASGVCFQSRLQTVDATGGPSPRSES